MIIMNTVVIIIIIIIIIIDSFNICKDIDYAD